jgi:hypothetical protein
MLAVLEDVDMPAAAKTVAASLAAGAFRIFLMPVDALKTIMQVHGRLGCALCWWSGAAAATMNKINCSLS